MDLGQWPTAAGNLIAAYILYLNVLATFVVNHVPAINRYKRFATAAMCTGAVWQLNEPTTAERLKKKRLQSLFLYV